MLSDPPIYIETHEAIQRRWKRKKWVCPELTTWLVVVNLAELSDTDRAQAEFDAVNAVNNGWTTAKAAA
jgi:hypothetical protein